jgi:hypothetical protein
MELDVGAPARLPADLELLPDVVDLGSAQRLVTLETSSAQGGSKLLKMLVDSRAVPSER